MTDPELGDEAPEPRSRIVVDPDLIDDPAPSTRLFDALFVAAVGLLLAVVLVAMATPRW